jgi:hypothetical protein
MPKQTAGYDELAAAVAKDTDLSAEQAPVNREDGMQVTLEEALTFAPSFGGKLNSPDDPLPPSSIRCFALILTALAGAHKPRVGRSCLVASAVCGFEEGGVSGKVMRDALLSDMLS